MFWAGFLIGAAVALMFSAVWAIIKGISLR